MATNLENAALAALVYNDQRGGGNGSPINRLPLPPGWQSLSDLGFTAGDNLNALNPFSFTGGAYLNAATGEIVIAYKGTDFLLEFAGRAWNTAGDLAADLGLTFDRLLPLGIGQQLSASAYYLAVKDGAVQHGHDPARSNDPHWEMAA